MVMNDIKNLKIQLKDQAFFYEIKSKNVIFPDLIVIYDNRTFLITVSDQENVSSAIKKLSNEQKCLFKNIYKLGRSKVMLLCKSGFAIYNESGF